MDMELCEEKHKNIDAALEKHDKNFGDIFPRLTELEKSDATTKEQIKTVCKSMDELTASIKTAIKTLIGLMVALIAFFIKLFFFK